MTFKNVVLTVFGLLLVTATANAQLNVLNAKTPEDIGKKTEAQIAYDNDEPLPYGYTDERDILWSKTTWEIIDLDERVNFPLYYPIDTNNIGSERRSLYDVLVKNIKNGNIEHIYADSYFTEKRTLKDLSASLVYSDTTDLGIEQLNAEGIVDPQYIRRFDLDAGDIEEWRIRGIWYLDKRQGELKYRLLGLCPVANEARSKAFPDDMIDSKVELFWVWFPGARKALHEAKAFNRKNTSQPISYDHLLNSRRFNAMIYKEDNVQGDRGVRDYINDNAMMQLLEAERIKDQIRNMEIDLWNY
ncbi:MAG TPA: gliding motility protein GldN [Flavobacteriaceae bacterium]|jgi:gliding motility associated protien GldN|nr:gliding motility protein GldN [Flavobacteriaceae bacterium]MAY51861.1 gliding motility protein GldN [Flavobacteriaceae bacterium]HBR53955.1 gliding motility protein GldN [Flavobacteriaceae bacterium]HIB49478.1 gliding motility protein GldN [Flavobacteriaceae bacterium]HIN98121.1 gliding motility protein GldN [Flavobacteriaceae bacterium]|tara:strand:+ start:521 stop:1423 length:903 start_codon:yes stop_codon:yes gene_type:complete